MSLRENIKVANWFLQKGLDSDRPLTQMQLQKLVYFGHALKLAESRKPLVQGEFEAWEYGPVLPELYSQTKFAGRMPIGHELALPSEFSILHLEKPRISESEDISVFESTWKTFGHLSAIELSNISHEDGAPWAVAWAVGKGTRISNESIGDFYRRRLKGA